jgi:hypothetical protein
VDWYDASTRAGWLEKEDMPALAFIKSRGWIGGETDQTITVCNSYADDGTFGDCTIIPKPWIKRRKGK